MEVFTLCNCENITNSYVAHCEYSFGKPWPFDLNFCNKELLIGAGEQTGCPYGVITARVRTYDGRLCFHRCVSVQLLGGYPIPGLGRGVPHLRSG